MSNQKRILVARYRYRYRYIVEAALFVVFLGILYAGLTPFQFYPKNRVSWLSPNPGLRFDRPAIAYTKSGFAWPASYLSQGLTFELYLRPFDEPHPGFDSILTLFDGDPISFLTFAQWKDGLSVRIRRAESESHAHPFWWPGALHLLPKHEKRFITISSTPNAGTRIYVDGKFKTRSRKHPILHNNQPLEGKIVLGSQPNGRSGWRGEIYGIAIYREALPAETIADHFERVEQGGFTSLANATNLIAFYPFSEGAGRWARDPVAKQSPIAIPEHFLAQQREFFVLPPPTSPTADWYYYDRIRNTLGFIPVGFLGALVLFRRRNELSLFQTALYTSAIGAMLSFGIEFTQAFMPQRASSIADISCNTLGTIIGACIALPLIHWYRTRLSHTNT